MLNTVLSFLGAGQESEKVPEKSDRTKENSSGSVVIEPVNHGDLPMNQLKKIRTYAKDPGKIADISTQKKIDMVAEGALAGLRDIALKNAELSTKHRREQADAAVNKITRKQPRVEETLPSVVLVEDPLSLTTRGPQTTATLEEEEEVEIIIDDDEVANEAVRVQQIFMKQFRQPAKCYDGTATITLSKCDSGVDILVEGQYENKVYEDRILFSNHLVEWGIGSGRTILKYDSTHHEDEYTVIWLDGEIAWRNFIGPVETTELGASEIMKIEEEATRCKNKCFQQKKEGMGTPKKTLLKNNIKKMANKNLGNQPQLSFSSTTTVGRPTKAIITTPSSPVIPIDLEDDELELVATSPVITDRIPTTMNLRGAQLASKQPPPSTVGISKFFSGGRDDAKPVLGMDPNPPRLMELTKKKKTGEDLEEDDRLLFTYPEGHIDSVSITVRDKQKCLENVFLNDSIIDFYMKYMLNDIERRKVAFPGKGVHIFTSFLFTLLSIPLKGPQGAKLLKLDDESKARERYQVYSQVKKWSAGIDIFSRICVVFPVNLGMHWSVAACLFEDAVNGQPPRGVLLSFDSFNDSSSHKMTEIASIIRLYLSHEYECKIVRKNIGSKKRQAGSVSPITTTIATAISQTEEDADDEPEIVKIDKLAKDFQDEDAFELKLENYHFTTQTLPEFRIVVPKQQDDVNCGIHVLNNAKVLVDFLMEKYRHGFSDSEDLVHKLRDRFLTVTFATEHANYMRKDVMGVILEIARETEQAKTRKR